MSEANGGAPSLLAVIGCGAVVERFYEPALREAGRALVFVDPVLERARAFAERFPGAEAADSLASILGRACHAVVATPPASHYSVCGALLDAGIHVLCEKPFVLEPAQGRDLVERAARANLRLHVNQTRRLFPASRAARRLLAEGAIGEPTRVTVRFGARFNWPARTAFHSRPDYARHGILSDQGSHVFDLAGWLFGRELEPLAVRHDGYAGPESTVQVDFSCGPVRGDAIMTWLVDNSASRFQIDGTRGRIILDDDHNRALVQRDGRQEEVSQAPAYPAYHAIAGDLLAALLGDAPAGTAVPASSVLSSIVFLDRAYSMAKATLPRVTDIKADVG